MSKRIQRTYQVTLNDAGQVSTFRVNLTYDVDGMFNAVENGRVVPDLMAEHAAVNRLRRLSDKGRVDVSREVIDRSAWDVRLRNWRLVDA
jgi:hypothetical protein